MNVIFLDFDGVIDTVHYITLADMEEKIKILSKICHEYDCKVVIEASIKWLINEETLEIEEEVEWVKHIFNCFKKYDIECIGRTPCVSKYFGNGFFTPIWKEFEIKKYLFNHPEIDHFCIIDDDDLGPIKSDLKTLREYLVETIYYSDNKEEEGLLEEHSKQVGEILKLDNKYKKLAIKKAKIKKRTL
ncbi:MAG: hypothetical protein IKF36_06280 [Bacilli bacterium]|nr:hypothetical protein [Bacilli bacterium]